MDGDLKTSAGAQRLVPSPRRSVEPSSYHLPDLVQQMAERLSEPLVVLVDQGTGPRLAWSNSAAGALLGWDARELATIAPSVMKLAPAGDLAHLLSTLRPESGPVMLVGGTGEKLQARATSVPLASSEGMHAWGVLLHGDDGRALARGERQAELRLAALAQNVPVGIAFSEVGLRLGYVNDTFARLVGRTVDEMLGTGWLALLADTDRDRLMGALDSAAEGGEFEHVIKVLRADGESRWLSARFSVIPVLDRAAGFVATFEDVTERRQHEASLSWEARHDALTGLGNRQQFDEALQRAVGVRGAVGADSLPLLEGAAVIFIDLDDFKTVNDRLGHDAGDQLLVEFGARLRRTVAERDLVCRLGGDEFVVLCDGIQSDRESEEIADRLLHALRAPVIIGSGSVTISASIGVLRADGTRTARDLLRDADAAMYAAKQSGKDRVVGSAQMLRSRVSVDPLRMLGALRDDLVDGKLRVVYQPIQHLSNGRMLSVEALARWDGPDGPVPPAVFIPMAETAGLIAQLGEQVLRSACTELAGWRAVRGGRLPRRVCVNISAAQLADPAFPALVASVLEETGLPADALDLELTEQVAVADLTTGLATLTVLREMGVGIALDDFGTGYCSLTYLHRLPVTTLKLDRSFTAALEEPAAARVVRSMTRLGLDLGLTVIAEGIERVEQVTELRRFGCRYGQGYFLGMPQTPHELRTACSGTAR